jgi:hypothetical protein
VRSKKLSSSRYIVHKLLKFNDQAY